MASDDRTARSAVRTDTPLANIRLREIDHAFRRRNPGNEPSGFSPLFRGKVVDLVKPHQKSLMIHVPHPIILFMVCSVTGRHA